MKDARFNGLTISDPTNRCAVVTPEGYLLVQDLSLWANHFLYRYQYSDGSIVVEDPKTGDQFEIRKVRK